MNKKGTVMAEAAMVFPIVILAVAALIFVFQFFYQQTEMRVEIHKALRAESGEIHGTMKYHRKPETPFPVYRKGGTLCCYGTMKSKKKWFLEKQEKELMSEKYLDDEKQFVRMADLIKQKEKTNGK